MLNNLMVHLIRNPYTKSHQMILIKIINNNNSLIF